LAWAKPITVRSLSILVQEFVKDALEVLDELRPVEMAQKPVVWMTKRQVALMMHAA
jgi:hypothetical protein